MRVESYRLASCTLNGTTRVNTRTIYQLMIERARCDPTYSVYRKHNCAFSPPFVRQFFSSSTFFFHLFARLFSILFNIFFFFNVFFSLFYSDRLAVCWFKSMEMKQTNDCRRETNWSRNFLNKIQLIQWNFK